MKQWTIQAGGQPYEIKVQGWNLWINDTPHKLRKQPHRLKLLFWSEYDLPIPGAKVMLTTGTTSWDLVVDGVNAVTGAPYQMSNKLPIWSYVFCALNLVNLINGAIGGLFAALGVFATMKIVVGDKPLPVKLLLSLLILVGCWAAVFAVAILLQLLLWG